MPRFRLYWILSISWLRRTFWFNSNNRNKFCIFYDFPNSKKQIVNGNNWCISLKLYIFFLKLYIQESFRILKRGCHRDILIPAWLPREIRQLRYCDISDENLTHSNVCRLPSSLFFYRFFTIDISMLWSKNCPSCNPFPKCFSGSFLSPLSLPLPLLFSLLQICIFPAKELCYFVKHVPLSTFFSYNTEILRS